MDQFTQQLPLPEGPWLAIKVTGNYMLTQALLRSLGPGVSLEKKVDNRGLVSPSQALCPTPGLLCEP